ncbi:MAG: hypothetical protein IJT02_07205 [Synergistaceae bacterium]|nr:hypothetical protein [Synergistaceae bacterium]
MARRLFAAVLAVMLFAGVASARDIALGTFTVKAPDSFVNGTVTSADREEGITAYYKSAETLMDFDVYEFPKEEPFEEFVKSFAAPNLTREEINGIKAAVYRSTDESEGQEYSTLNYILEDEKEYIMIVFWLDGEEAEPQALAIINSLSR